MSWIAQSGGNHAERGVAEKSIGIGESWRVEGIEELASDLQLHALSHQERFGESNINILNAIGAQIGEVARRIAGLLIARIRKATQVEHAGAGQGGPVWAHSTPRIRAHNVRPLVAICNRWCGHANGNRLSRLIGQTVGDAPTSDHRIQNAIHALSNPASSPDRNVKENGSGKPMRGVISADRVLSLQVV